MTTYIPFTPSQTAQPPFTATITLDGAGYALTATWNFPWQRWYVWLLQGTTVVGYQPLVGSPSGGTIYLFPGTFDSSTILFNEDTGNFEINP